MVESNPISPQLQLWVKGKKPNENNGFNRSETVETVNEMEPNFIEPTVKAMG